MQISEPGLRDVIRINFQDGNEPAIAGDLVDQFQGFADRDNGFVYGWVTEASATDADGTTAVPIMAAAYPDIAINERTGAPFDDYDPRLTGYAHFDLSSYPERAAWEIALPDGAYEVTVSVGDTGGANDSANRLHIEGELTTAWVPTDLFKSQLVTTTATVTDGFLTLSAQGGTTTEMQYLEIRPLADLTPADGNPAAADYARLANPVALGPVGTTPQPIGFGDGVRPDDVDPTRAFAFDVETVAGRGGVLPTSLTADHVKLFATLTGEEVALSLNTTGGFDALIINPVTPLAENTSYTLVVDGLLDQGPDDDPAGTPREFQKYTTSFVTGTAPPTGGGTVAFTDTVMAVEAALASVAFSPDGSKLYASTLTGSVIRWDLDASGAIVEDSRQEFSDALIAGNAIIGLAFDPTDPDRLWITANEGGLTDASPFSGRIVTLDIDPDDTAFTAATNEVVVGLPRSVRDHLTNSLAFRANPDADQPGEPSHLLYLSQGANSSIGAPDNAWGFRSERALTAAILEIDPTVADGAAPLDVQTEADWTASRGPASFDPLSDPANPNTYNPDGSVTGFYNPFAEDAPVRVFASGTRNAYDLVWHSNGSLYVPTNGSAGGARRAPDDPTTAEFEGITNITAREDYLYIVEAGGYYGHPNPIRGEFILNGGNPTAAADPAEVPSYPVGIQPDPNFRGFDFDFGRNVSPNGAAEYTSDVFGSDLQGALIVTQYSAPDNLIALIPGADGEIVDSTILRRSDGSEINYADPLDVVVDPTSGRIYLVTFNQANGQSELVRLDPVVDGDMAADTGLPLALVVQDASDPAAVVFQVLGLDDDVASLAMSYGGVVPDGAVVLDAEGRFTVDLSGATGPVTATLTITDASGNNAIDAVEFAPGDTAATLFVDAVDFAVLNRDGTIVRRLDAPASFEPASADDLDPVDGLNDGHDGIAYLDPSGAAGDKATVVLDVATAGTYDVLFRMANGSGDARPMAFSIGDQRFVVDDTRTASFADWQTFAARLRLEEGANTVVVSQVDDGGAANVDSVTAFLDTPAAGDGLVARSLDPGIFEDRLHFSWLDDPSESDGDGQDRGFKATAALQLTNQGTTTLQLVAAEIEGPFAFVEPDVLDGLQLAPGGTIEVEVRFDRDAFEPPVGARNVIDRRQEVIDGVLTLSTDDPDQPPTTIDLAAFWQPEPEGGWEPNVNEVWELLGLGNDIEGLTPVRGGRQSALGFFDLLLPVDETEIISPYFQIAPDVGAASLTHLGAFHGPNQGVLFAHNPANRFQWADLGAIHDANYNQTILPLGNGEDGFTAKTFTRRDVPFFWEGSNAFGIYIGGTSSNPDVNPTGGRVPTQAELDQRFPGYVVEGQTVFDPAGRAVPNGHYVRMFQAVDDAGQPIANTFIGLADFPAVNNFDYNDHVFLLEGVTPIGFGQEISLVGLDAAPDGRLVFSRIDQPVAEQITRDEASFEITNAGFGPLTIASLALAGDDAAAFEILAAPAAGTVLAAGETATVTIAFVGVDPRNDGDAMSYEARLDIVSDDFDEPVTTVALAGLAQFESENGEEPTSAEIVAAFGYGTDVAQGLLANGGLVEAVGDEVLMPYMTRLDPNAPVEVIQLASYLQQGDVSRLYWHGLTTGELAEIYAADDQQGQTVLPDELLVGPGSTGTTASGTITPAVPFGLKIGVDDRPTFAAWSDPNTNLNDPAFASLTLEGGHYLRFFQLKDAAGDVVEGAFIGLQDYVGGGNFDYNDHVFLIRNVAAYTLTTAEDANLDGVNDALQVDIDGDAITAFFDADEDFDPGARQQPFNPTATPWLLGTDGLTLAAVDYDDGGRGVAYSDAPGLQGGTGGDRGSGDVEVVSSGAVGYVAADDWLEYTIEVAAAGRYELVLDAALGSTYGARRTVTATFDDGDGVYATAVADVSFTGAWDAFAPTTPVAVDLAAGVQVLRLTFDGGAQDLRNFTLQAEPSDDDATLTALAGATIIDEPPSDLASSNDADTPILTETAETTTTSDAAPELHLL